MLAMDLPEDEIRSWERAFDDVERANIVHDQSPVFPDDMLDTDLD
jgi:hypothetical protein